MNHFTATHHSSRSPGGVVALSATATLRRTLRDLTLTEVRAGGSSETVAIARVT